MRSGRRRIDSGRAELESRLSRRVTTNSYLGLGRASCNVHFGLHARMSSQEPLGSFDVIDLGADHVACRPDR